MNTQIPLPSEKFELLSAYLDGEVSQSERQQVEDWLDSDPDVQRLHQQMLALQDGLKSMPVAAPCMPPEQLVTQVMARLDRRHAKQRWLWGSLGATAALVVGALSGLLTGNSGERFQMAQQPQPRVPSIALRPTESVDTKALMIKLERPPVAIPVVPVSNRSNGLEDDSANF